VQRPEAAHGARLNFLRLQIKTKTPPGMKPGGVFSWPKAREARG
jgi:hypothetical protein